MLTKSLLAGAAAMLGVLALDIAVPTLTGAAAQNYERERNSWSGYRYHNSTTTTRSTSGQRDYGRRETSGSTRYDPYYKTREQIDQMHEGNGSLRGPD